jgi:hypothetical protein
MSPWPPHPALIRREHLRSPGWKQHLNQPNGSNLQHDMVESGAPSSPLDCEDALCRGNSCLLMRGLGLSWDDLHQLRCSECRVCSSTTRQPPAPTRRPRLLPTLRSNTGRAQALVAAACTRPCLNSTCGDLYLHGLNCNEVSALGSGCGCHSCCSRLGFSFPALIMSRYEERDKRYERAQRQARLGGFSPGLTRGVFGLTSRCHPALPSPNASNVERGEHIRKVVVENYVEAVRQELLLVVERNLPHVLFDDDVVLTTTRSALVAYLDRTTSRFDLVPLGGCIYGKPTFFEFMCSHATWLTPHAAKQMLALTDEAFCETFAFGMDRIMWRQLCWHRRVRCAPWLHLAEVYEATTTGGAKWKPFHDRMKILRNQSSSWESVRVTWGNNQDRDHFGVGYYVQDRKHFKPYLHRHSGGNPNRGMPARLLWADKRLNSSRRGRSRTATRLAKPWAKRTRG